MREIKFRAKNENNEWVFVPVKGNMVGQYTGVKDKNGKEIYEGDIVILCNSNHDEEDGGAQVIFEYGSFLLEGTGFVVDLCGCYADELEVIGNIYDNPELIEE